MADDNSGDFTEMSRSDHHRVIAEVDTLADELASTMRDFEATGFSAVLKEDYVELHRLEHRLRAMRRQHICALDERDTQSTPPSTAH